MSLLMASKMIDEISKIDVDKITFPKTYCYLDEILTSDALRMLFFLEMKMYSKKKQQIIGKYADDGYDMTLHGRRYMVSPDEVKLILKTNQKKLIPRSFGDQESSRSKLKLIKIKRMLKRKISVDEIIEFINQKKQKC